MSIRGEKIFNLLSESYPDAETELNFTNAYELLIAVILSAQCTDKRVNLVTPNLFARFPTVYDMAQASREEVEKLIHSCGFYHNKAKNIISASQKIVSDFAGEVPNSQEVLETLPGVGRKTANVVYAVAFGGDAIAVDTHVFRVSKRIGLSKGTTPQKVEKDLQKVFNQKDWAKAHHLLIFHGRRCCHSRKPNCLECNLKEVCRSYKDEQNS